MIRSCPLPESTPLMNQVGIHRVAPGYLRNRNTRSPSLIANRVLLLRRPKTLLATLYTSHNPNQDVHYQ